MIKPTHIAEDLIAGMYNQSPSVREFFAEELNWAISFNATTTAVPDSVILLCPL
jgi:hypothetical protein